MELPFSELREVAAEIKFEQVTEIRSPMWDPLSRSHLLNSPAEVSERKPEARGRSRRKTQIRGSAAFETAGLSEITGQM